MDSYDCDELKIAIYQFLNGSNLEVFKSKESENKPITESNEFIELTKDKETPYSCGVCVNDFPQILQLWGLMPVCVSRCDCMF
jgi:hypothetical protein